MGQPPALLPEQGEQDGADHVDGEVGGHRGARDGRGEEQEVRCDFVHVVHRRGIEQASGEDLRTQLAVPLLEGLLLLGLEFVGVQGRRNDGLVEITNLEFLQITEGRWGMECGENVGAIITSVGEDDRAACRIK